jgi:hypothetical protein
MESRDDAWAIEVIKRACGLQQLRLNRGKIRRARYASEIAEGKNPTGPRIDWISGTATKIYELLYNAASEFNNKNPDDLASAQDLIDILNTAQSYLKSVVEKT